MFLSFNFVRHGAGTWDGSLILVSIILLPAASASTGGLPPIGLGSSAAAVSAVAGLMFGIHGGLRHGQSTVAAGVVGTSVQQVSNMYTEVGVSHEDYNSAVYLLLRNIMLKAPQNIIDMLASESVDASNPTLKAWLEDTIRCINGKLQVYSETGSAANALADGLHRIYAVLQKDPPQKVLEALARGAKSKVLRVSEGFDDMFDGGAGDDGGWEGDGADGPVLDGGDPGATQRAILAQSTATALLSKTIERVFSVGGSAMNALVGDRSYLPVCLQKDGKCRAPVAVVCSCTSTVGWTAMCTKCDYRRHCLMSPCSTRWCMQSDAVGGRLQPRALLPDEFPAVLTGKGVATMAADVVDARSPFSCTVSMTLPLPTVLENCCRCSCGASASLPETWEKDPSHTVQIFQLTSGYQCGRIISVRCLDCSKVRTLHCPPRQTALIKLARCDNQLTSAVRQHSLLDMAGIKNTLELKKCNARGIPVSVYGRAVIGAASESTASLALRGPSKKPVSRGFRAAVSYSMCAVVEHVGKDPHVGHYIAHTKAHGAGFSSLPTLPNPPEPSIGSASWFTMSDAAEKVPVTPAAVTTKQASVLFYQVTSGHLATLRAITNSAPFVGHPDLPLAPRQVKKKQEPAAPGKQAGLLASHYNTTLLRAEAARAGLTLDVFIAQQYSALQQHKSAARMPSTTPGTTTTAYSFQIYPGTQSHASSAAAAPPTAAPPKRRGYAASLLVGAAAMVTASLRRYRQLLECAKTMETAVHVLLEVLGGTWENASISVPVKIALQKKVLALLRGDITPQAWAAMAEEGGDIAALKKSTSLKKSTKRARDKTPPPEASANEHSRPRNITQQHDDAWGNLAVLSNKEQKLIAGKVTAWITRLQESIVRDLLRETRIPADQLSFDGETAFCVSDARDLLPETWLRDNTMNVFIYLLRNLGLASRRDRPNDTHGHVLLFHTFFWTQIKVDGYSYENVKAWNSGKTTKKRKQAAVDIFQYRLLLVPINRVNRHWLLAVIHMTARTISVWDPEGKDDGLDVFKVLSRYIGDEHMDKKKEALSGQPFKHVKQPPSLLKQPNGYDCGVFVCAYCELLTRGVMPSEEMLSSENICAWRSRILLSCVGENKVPKLNS